MRKVDFNKEKITITLFIFMLIFGMIGNKSYAGIFDSIAGFPGRKMAEIWTNKNKNNIDLDITSMSNTGNFYVFFKGKIHNRTSSKITSAHINLIIQNKQTGAIALTKKIKIRLNVFPSGTQDITGDPLGNAFGNGTSTDCNYCSDIFEAIEQLGNNSSWHYELLYFESE